MQPTACVVWNGAASRTDDPKQGCASKGLSKCPTNPAARHLGRVRDFADSDFVQLGGAARI